MDIACFPVLVRLDAFFLTLMKRIMYFGSLFMCSLAFLIPLDLVMCWTVPPFSLLRMLEHLAMSVFGLLVDAPLAWVPLAVWAVSLISMLPARRLLKLPCGEEFCPHRVEPVVVKPLDASTPLPMETRLPAFLLRYAD